MFNSELEKIISQLGSCGALDRREMGALTSDSVLAILAFGSCLVATLRAGSRAFYLMEHNQIDVMDGPLILGPNDVSILTNGTAVVDVSPLWELAAVFQQSVRLALDPYMEYRILSVDIPQEEKEEEKEPYSLSPFPVKRNVVVGQEPVEADAPNDARADNGGEIIDVEDLSEDIVGESSSDRLSQSRLYLPHISLRSMLGKVPLVNRWVGLQADESDDDESFSFDDTEIDGTWCCWLTSPYLPAACYSHSCCVIRLGL